MTKKQLTDLVNKIGEMSPSFLAVAVPFDNAAVVFGCYRGHSFAILWGREHVQNHDALTYMRAAEISGCSVLAAETFGGVLEAAKAISTAVDTRYALLNKEKTWNLINSNGNQTGH